MITNQIEYYFQAEKTESLIFIYIGLIAIILSLSIWLKLRHNRFLIGLSLPVLVIGLIQAIVGSAVYFRTDRQAEELLQWRDANPKEMRKAEIARMQDVNEDFETYRSIEIILSIVGIILITMYWSGKGFTHGIGWGLTIQSLIMLTLDFFAERRAAIYMEQLINWATG